VSEANKEKKRNGKRRRGEEGKEKERRGEERGEGRGKIKNPREQKRTVREENQRSRKRKTRQGTREISSKREKVGACEPTTSTGQFFYTQVKKEGDSLGQKVTRGGGNIGRAVLLHFLKNLNRANGISGFQASKVVQGSSSGIKTQHRPLADVKQEFKLKIQNAATTRKRKNDWISTGP